MADSKITALTSIGTSTDPVLDQMVIVDVSDGSMAATGTTKKVSLNQLLSSNPSATGGFTLSGALSAGSATISGDLTVDTNTLKVDSANNRVGIGTASPGYLLDVQAATAVANILSTTGTNTAYLQISNTGGYFYLGRENSAGTTFAAPAYSAVLYAGGAYPLVTTVNGGERYRIASDGVATWSNVGGVAGTAMTLNSTGLGVGVTPGYPLHVQRANAGPTAWLANSTTYSQLKMVSSGTNQPVYVTLNPTGTGAAIFQISDVDRLTIDSSGNVGVGVTPSAWQSGYKAIEMPGIGILGANGSADLYCNAYLNSSFQSIYRTTAAATNYAMGGGFYRWFIAPSGTAGNAITWTQAMTLDASGNLLVGLTVDSFAPAKGVSMFSGNSSRVAVGHANGTASGDYYHSFAYDGSVIGSITQNGTTGVLYNINSDYRLKESVAPLSGGLARINALKPSSYKWKSDGSAGEGFLAHELAEVVPFAVTGEKDAVNADGSIKSQGIDMSRIVPILVAAIKELTARVEALEA